MKESPTEITNYIKLTVTDALEKPEYKSWFNLVKDMSPDDTIGSIQKVDNNGEPHVVRMVTKEFKDGKVEYIIPLNRSLLDEEVEDIVISWNESYPEGDFQIETDSTPVENMYDVDSDEDDTVAYENAAKEIAKLLHEEWKTDLESDGWRYGTKISYKNKTHPLILPWEQLSEDAKKVNYNLPEKLIKIMTESDLI